MSSKHCQIDFDTEKKIFRLRTAIGSAKNASVEEYVEARAATRFRPHSTFYCVDQNRNVNLVQEISFNWGPGATLRRQMLEFWRIAHHCAEMLDEIAQEEGLEAVRLSER